MQSQAKTLRYLALLIITLLGHQSRANNLGWDSLQSKSIRIESYSSAQGDIISSYIPFLPGLGKLIWEWDPKVEELKNTSQSVYLEPSYEGFDGMMKALFVRFDVSNTQNFRKVWFQPKEGLKFRGLFGIHDFEKKRPLVILRMGIHGNVDELIAERFLAKVIYDDLDANILILESLTSHAFVSSNKQISFGGVDEGIQTFFVLNELQKLSLNKIISSTHLLAISMGAHGTFVTALLDQSNGHKIKSIVEFCPLINLQQTLENGETQGAKNAAISIWNVRRLRAVFDLYPNEVELQKWWQTFFDFKPRFTSSLINILNRDRKTPLISTTDIESLVPNMKWPANFKAHLENSKSFYELNNFWPYFQNVKTPIMIYTTPNDPLVINEINSEKIFKGQQPGDFSSVKFERLDKGVHCGLPSVYRWGYIVKLVKDGLL